MEKWILEKYPKNNYPFPENGGFVTNNGVVVRTKSEVFIANLLEEYNVPYRYEMLKKISNKTTYPDFIIKNPFTAKIILWEHFGALHLEEYELIMNDKMKRYQDDGYILDDTVIYTFQFHINQLERIRKLINEVIELE